ncbi:MAG: DMT family transporter [Roseovarius sp.]
MRAQPLHLLLLFAFGCGWGMSMPLAKIAVSTGHEPYGLIFWQLVVVVAVLTPVALIAGKPVKLRLRHLWFCSLIACTGAVLPDLFYYLGATHLPGGVLSILMASAPLFSLPIALALGNDRFSLLRLGGLMLGMVGVALMILPEEGLPAAVPVGFVLLTLLAPALYATEGNIVARWGTHGLDPFRTIVGASFIGMIITFPIAVLSGQWINPLESFGAPELALAASAAIHGLVYAGYVWLVGRAGSVFSAQVGYIATGFGVLWSILLLGESYSGWVWAALLTILAGVFLVQPRAPKDSTPEPALAPMPGAGDITGAGAATAEEEAPR